MDQPILQQCTSGNDLPESCHRYSGGGRGKSGYDYGGLSALDADHEIILFTSVQTGSHFQGILRSGLYSFSELAVDGWYCDRYR